MKVYNDNHQTCVLETKCGINMLKLGSFQNAVNHFMTAMNSFNTALNEEDSSEGTSTPLNQRYNENTRDTSFIVAIESKKLLVFEIGMADDDEMVSVLLIFNLAIGYACLSKNIGDKLASTLLKQKSSKLLMLSHDVLQEIIEKKLSRNEMASVETKCMVTILSMLAQLGRSRSIAVDVKELSIMECRLAILQYITGASSLETAGSAA
jgi:hypothetical protein